MEVLNENSAMLSNYEVYSLLSDISSGQHGQKKPKSNQQNLATIAYSTVKYLQGTSCKHQTPEIIENFLKAVKPFKLTQAETLQVLNIRPTTAVEIQLLIEESEERLTEDQIEELIETVKTCLPDDQDDNQDSDG